MIGIGAIIFGILAGMLFSGILIFIAYDIKVRYFIILHSNKSHCCNEYYVFRIIYHFIV